ncbi:unnamed protein product, partial [Adineta steineri]
MASTSRYVPSNIDTYGLLYQNSFNSSDATTNVVASDDDSGGNNQFMFGMYIDPTI